MPTPTLPAPLRKGDKIGVVATSWGGAANLSDRFGRSVSALETLGYRVEVMPAALKGSAPMRTWVAGDVADRVADLHTAFADPEIRCVLSLIEIVPRFVEVEGVVVPSETLP